jgi:hypothetical protein
MGKQHKKKTVRINPPRPKPVNASWVSPEIAKKLSTLKKEIAHHVYG